MRTIRAVVLSKTGGPEVLRVQEVPEPSELSEEEVLIRVQAAGVNYADILSREGLYSWAPPRPFIPGLEAVGEVIEKGKAVSHVDIGDQVLVGTRAGCYAELVKVHQSRVFPAIPQFSTEENAAFLASFMTANVALTEMARVRKGETILVQAAAGALGTAAVQLAKAKGLKVAGTSSQAHKLEFLENSLHIDLAINYQTTDFREAILQWTNGKGINVVLESVGGKVFWDSYKLLSPLGRIVIVGATSVRVSKLNPFSWYKAWKSIPKMNLWRLIRWSKAIMGFHLGWLLTERPDLLIPVWENLLEHVQKDQIRPVVDKVFPLEKAAEAHRRITSRKNLGKVLLKL